MIEPLLLTLLSLLANVRFVSAQQAGSFGLNATVPSPATSGTGCIILGQLTMSTTTTIEALSPICPSTAGDYASSPSTGDNISWPFSNNGNSYSSPMAIYAGVTHVDGNESPADEGGQTNPYQAQATCVMQLTEDQVQYLLGRSLTWNNALNELWDNTQNEFVMNGTEGGPINDLWLPDPYAYAASDETWKVAMTIPSSDSQSSISSSASSMATSVSSFVSASSSESIFTTDSTSSSSALVAIATVTPSNSTNIPSTTLASASTPIVDYTSASSSISSAAASYTDVISTSASVPSSSSSFSTLSTDSPSTTISSSAFESTSLLAIATDGTTVTSSDSASYFGSTSSSVSASSVSGSDSTSSSLTSAESTSASASSSASSSSVSSTSLKSTATFSTAAAGTTTAAATGSCVPVTITQMITTTVTASPDKRRFYGLI